MRSRTAAVLALLSTLALAACGGGASPDLSGVAQAAEKTQDAGTARFELTFEALGLPTSGAQAAFSATGAVDYERQQTHMELDLGTLASVFGGSEDTTLEAVLDGKVFYMRFPFPVGFIRPGKPWLKVDLERVAAESGADLSQLDRLTNVDPTQALAYLQGAGEFEAVGKEEVRGVETTHYGGVIDLQKALDQLSEAQKAQLEATGVEELPAEAWIDGDGLLRRITFRFSGLTDAPDASFAVSMELFDFGGDVDVEIPSEDEVTDLADLKAKDIDQG